LHFDENTDQAKENTVSAVPTPYVHELHILSIQQLKDILDNNTMKIFSYAPFLLSSALVAATAGAKPFGTLLLPARAQGKPNIISTQATSALTVRGGDLGPLTADTAAKALVGQSSELFVPFSCAFPSKIFILFMLIVNERVLIVEWVDDLAGHRRNPQTMGCQ
jgi:hypothetical protein